MPTKARRKSRTQRRVHMMMTENDKKCLAAPVVARIPTQLKATSQQYFPKKSVLEEEEKSTFSQLVSLTPKESTFAVTLLGVVPTEGECYTDSDSFADSDDDFSDTDSDSFLGGSQQQQELPSPPQQEISPPNRRRAPTFVHIDLSPQHEKKEKIISSAQKNVSKKKNAPTSNATNDSPLRKTRIQEKQQRAPSPPKQIPAKIKDTGKRAPSPPKKTIPVSQATEKRQRTLSPPKKSVPKDKITSSQSKKFQVKPGKEQEQLKSPPKKGSTNVAKETGTEKICVSLPTKTVEDSSSTKKTRDLRKPHLTKPDEKHVKPEEQQNVRTNIEAQAVVQQAKTEQVVNKTRRTPGDDLKKIDTKEIDQSPRINKALIKNEMKVKTNQDAQARPRSRSNDHGKKAAKNKVVAQETPQLATQAETIITSNVKEIQQEQKNTSKKQKKSKATQQVPQQRMITPRDTNCNIKDSAPPTAETPILPSSSSLTAHTEPLRAEDLHRALGMPFHCSTSKSFDASRTERILQARWREISKLMNKQKNRTKVDTLTANGRRHKVPLIILDVNYII